MQEINLLQNKLKDKTDQFDRNNRMIMVVLTLLLVVVLVATGAFFMLTKSAADAKVEYEKKNVEINTRLIEMEGQLKVAREFQAQSKNITTLLNSHVIWSEFIKDLTGNIFKSTKFSDLSLDTDGRIFIQGQVMNYTNLGKLLLGLESVKNVSEVTLLSTSANASGIEAGVTYSIEVFMDTSVLTSQD